MCAHAIRECITSWPIRPGRIGAILDGAWEWVDERMPAEQEVVWIVDETGNPKKGKHSVGVSHQLLRAIGQEGELSERGVRTGVELADSVYGNDSAFRAGLDQSYMVHVNPTHLVSLPGVKLLPPKPVFGSWVSIHSAALWQGA